VSVSLCATDSRSLDTRRSKTLLSLIWPSQSLCPEDFWEIKKDPGARGLILEPGDFYILASKEEISVPPEWAAEMVPMDQDIGEFRIHYAGFFDPGSGT